MNSPLGTSDHTRFDLADLDFSQTHGHDTQSSYSIVQRVSLSDNTSEKEMVVPYSTKDTSSETLPDSWRNESWDSPSVLDANKSSTHRAPRPSGKALKLGAKKTVKASDKASEKAGSDTPTLGSEFEIPVVAVKSSVPDFFADMAPTIDFSTHDMPGHRSTGFNDKLAVANETSQVSHFCFRCFISESKRFRLFRRDSSVSKNAQAANLPLKFLC